MSRPPKLRVVEPGGPPPPPDAGRMVEVIRRFAAACKRDGADTGLCLAYDADGNPTMAMPTRMNGHEIMRLVALLELAKVVLFDRLRTPGDPEE